MHDEHPHPLLAQVPLTVSPFLNLPTATPLPYTYRQLPSTLPPSILSQPPTNQNQGHDNQQHPSQQHFQPAYITSANNQTSSTPDDILRSCLALQQHLTQLEASARQTLKEWEDRRRAEDLAEKRRVAPGWLDGDVKLLVPENVNDLASKGQGQLSGQQSGYAQDVDMMDGGGDAMGGGYQEQGHRSSVGVKAVQERQGVPDSREGEELDRVFGGLELK